MPTRSGAATGSTLMAMPVCCFARAKRRSVGWAKAPLRRAHHLDVRAEWWARFALPTLRSTVLVSTLSHHALRQQFRDLNRVECGAFQELIGSCEYRDRMAASVAEIPANAADQDIILSRRIDRHRKIILDPIVHDLHARRIRQDRAHLALDDRVFAFEGNRRAMRPQHRHAH